MQATLCGDWKRPFYILWGGQALSMVGSALVQFALVWWLAQTTKSATILALAALFAQLPMIFLGPVAGVVADRWSRRLVMIASDCIVAFITLLLALLWAIGSVQVWHIYSVLLIRAAAGAFQFPAMQASTSLMVPDEHLSRIAGYNQTLQGALSMATPPLGALLLTVLPLQGVLAIDVATACFGILPLLFIMIPQPPEATAGQSGRRRSSFWDEMGDGVRYLRAWPGLVGVLFIAMLVNFVFSPASALWPIWVIQYFKGGAFHLALLESASGIGIIAGGVALSIWGGCRRRILTALAGVVGLGLGLLLTGLTSADAFPLAVVCVFFIAAMIPIIDGPIMAIVQSTVDPALQGRVFSLILSLSAAIAPLGLIAAGPASDLLGVRAWYAAGGLLCVLLGVAAFFRPAIVHIEDQHA